MIQIDPLDLEYLTEDEAAEIELMLAEEARKVTFEDIKIRTKGKRLVTFDPNDVQVAYLDMLTQEYPPFDWRNHIYTLKGIREDVVKFRQPGISTLWLILYFIDTINNPLTETVIYAHDGVGTEKLFKIIHRAYINLPEAKKRPIKYSSKKELVFEDIDSGLYVGVVGGATLGRGGTTNNAHLSERAWSDNFQELEIGLLQSVPADGNVSRETTANGLNEYYQERQEVLAGRSEFRPRFFACYEHAEYKKPVPEGFVRTADEDAIYQRYKDKGLDDGFLVWRRGKLLEPGMRQKFQQEYPLSEEEAFMTSGKYRFDIEWLRARSEELKKPEYDPIAGLVFSPDTASRLRRAYQTGELELWELPQSGHYYIVTADPSMGLTENGDTDYCSADVLDADTWEQVGKLHGMWTPHEFAPLTADLATWYNMALLVVLNQGRPGGATVENLVNVVGYPKQRGRGHSGVFYFAPSEITGKAKQDDPSRLEAGFPENVMTKQWMLDKLDRAISIVPGLTINSRKTIQEMMTYIYLPGGGTGADKGSHDDAVSSIAIGAALLNLRFERTAGREILEQKPYQPRYGDMRGVGRG